MGSLSSTFLLSLRLLHGVRSVPDKFLLSLESVFLSSCVFTNIPIAPPYIKVFSLVWKNEVAQLSHRSRPAHWAGDASLRLTLGRTYATGPSPSLVRRLLLLSHLIDVILFRCAPWPALSVGGTYSYGLHLMVWDNSRNVINKWGSGFGPWNPLSPSAILFCYFHLLGLLNLIFLLRMIR